ncbi:hypothetical protein E1B28_000301 [Marasmius oreades]|uniref:F-box domain-containing protein n=1 Tax=Marasmius oreades TaxID=181124 RepID=A0A9P7V155_9AGAR|nr:uncharacterized protein E1B28_000301 [Marasmius oreades]KAG7098342.1 hypothetical protein E1B28_000301 [Marasmius oreades]
MNENCITPPTTTSSTSLYKSIRLPFRCTVTEFHRPLIAKSLSAAERQSNELADEVERLKGAIMILEKRRFEVEENIKTYKSLMAPVHRTPPEVMVEIFEYCCSTNYVTRTNRKPSHSLIPPALEISMVCGRWRELAITAPSLWSSMHIVRGDVTTFQANMYRAAKLFLARSKSHPIMLCLVSEGLQNEPDVADMFVQQSTRLRSLTLSIACDGTSGLTLGAIRGRLPILSDLALQGDLRSPDIISNVFETAPALRSLSLERNFITSNLCLPWRQIRSIRLYDSKLNRMLQVLGLCLDLEDIELVDIHPDEFDAGNHLVLHRTRRLSIATTQARCMAEAIHQITCPHLMSLEISDDGDNWNLPWNISSIATDLLQPTCVLTSLHLQGVPATDTDLIALLRQVPTLQTLFVQESFPTSFPRERNLKPTNMTVTSSFLRQLFLSHELLRESQHMSEIFLPNLKYLTLDIHAEGLDQRALVNAILSRCPDPNRGRGKIHTKVDRNLPASLLSFAVTVTTRDRIDSFDVLKALQCFNAAGLGVSINIEHDVDDDDDDESDDDDEDEDD